ncbi:MAG TPA: hypothetical protein VI159_07235, partial [Gemmatimonadales bacterium]
PVSFVVTNAGSIPHAFEVEGRGVEQETAVIQPGDSAELTVTLRAGKYEVYCPVGNDSHKKLGMEAQLDVGAKGVGSGDVGPETTKGVGSGDVGPETTKGVGSGDVVPSEYGEHRGSGARSIRVTGGGPVIQILPGPFPFADSAAPVLAQFGAEKEGLESQSQNGPYSNNVAPIAGTFTFTAWDFGAVRDSVDGVAQFTDRDGARWRLVLDRVQTKDVPHHPRFGGVIFGLYYHGNTGVHTPLVPTINSKVALWAVGHLFRNDSLVTGNAQVHVMLLSHTRRAPDWAIGCWDCSRNPVDELQLQVLPGPGEPKFETPGGFLFVNWERSAGR